MTGLVIVLFILLVLPDLSEMLHKPRLKDIAVYALVWVAGLAYSITVANGIYPTAVTQMLRAVFEPIGKLLIIPPPG